MAMALRLKRGELSKPSAEVKKVATGMSEKKLREFAKSSTHHKSPMRYHKRKES